MSALDDAIAAQLVHGAGAGADPLTDSLCDQAHTQPAELDGAPPLRAGWENEPIYVPMPLWLAALALWLGCFAFGPSLDKHVAARAAAAQASQAGAVASATQTGAR
jgi:hypothetical protein